MTTTLTATPQPATASVLLEVETDIGPVLLLDLDAADIAAEGAWAGDYSSSGMGTLGYRWGAGTSSPPFYAQRPLTGLTIGKEYRLELDLHQGSLKDPSRVGIVGIGYKDVPYGTSKTIVEFTATATTHHFRIVCTNPTIEAVFPYTAQIIRMVLLELPPDYTFSLTRSDANGVRPVRLRDGETLIGSAMLVTDYEAALVGTITYTVTITDTEAATDTTSLGLEQIWLSAAVAPHYSEQVPLITGYTAASESTTTVHAVIGREDPVLTLGRLSLRRGTLDIWVPTYAAAEAVRGLYGLGEVVLLRQGQYPGADMYHAAGGRVVVEALNERTSPRRWRVTVEDYVEVKPPTAPLTGGLGWTYAESTARNATYGESAAEFPTYGDLYIGPTS